MLEVLNLWCGYEQADVLRGLNLSVAPGEVVAIVGRNGVGKSTLCKAVAGELRVRKGHIALNGRDITKLRPYRRFDAGLVYAPEGGGVIGDLTVLEHLELAIHNARQTKDGGTLSATLDMFSALRGKENIKASTLSGGERQMLSLAIASAVNPAAVILDEPSHGLSISARQVVGALIERLRNDARAIVITEQFPRLAHEIAPTVFVLRDGILERSS